jgi:hypothetical protein
MLLKLAQEKLDLKHQCCSRAENLPQGFVQQHIEGDLHQASTS